MTERIVDLTEPALNWRTAVEPGTREPILAILIPCFNEVATIAKVVGDFRRLLPEAQVHVYDNNSTDGTAEAARKAGAIVRNDTWLGKGSVVRRMFADVDADIYVMVDGDDTYDARSATLLVNALLSRGLDMVNGARITAEKAAYRGRPNYTVCR